MCVLVCLSQCVVGVLEPEKWFVLLACTCKHICHFLSVIEREHACHGNTAVESSSCGGVLDSVGVGCVRMSCGSAMMSPEREKWFYCLYALVSVFVTFCL